MTISNYYDRCRFFVNEDGNFISKCTNFLHGKENLVLFDKQFSMASNHYCAILYNKFKDSHNEISCSGTILHAKNNVFNPLSISSFDLDSMIPMPTYSFSSYYLKDVRMNFNQSITKIECFDNHKTCLTMDDGVHFCLGNVNDVLIFYATSSFLLPMMFGLLIFLLNYLFTYRVSFFDFTLQLIGVVLFINAFVVIVPLAYASGFFFTLLLFVLLFQFN